MASLKSTGTIFTYWVSRVTVLTAVFLCVGNAPLKNQPVDGYRQQDDFTGYCNFLFDTIDLEPRYLSNKGDSLLATVWRDAKHTQEHIAYFELVTNIAYHLLQNGQVAASASWYEKGLQYYQHTAPKDTLFQQQVFFEEYVCKPLGNNYTRLGDFNKAIYIQELGIRSATALKRKAIIPALYGNMATTYFWKQQYDSVQAIADEGLQAAHPLDPVNVLLYNIKTEAYLETARQDSAGYWNNKALQFIKKSQNSEDWFTASYFDKAILYRNEKHYDQSLQYLLKSWQAAAAGTSSREKAKMANAVAKGYYLLQEYEKAASWYQVATSFFIPNKEALYPDHTYTTALFGTATVYEAQQKDSAAWYYQLAVENDFFTQQLVSASLNSQSDQYVNEANTNAGILFFHQLFEKTGQQQFLKKALWLTELNKSRQLLVSQQRTAAWQHDSLLSKNASLIAALKNEYLLLELSKEVPEKQLIQKRINALEFSLNIQENQYAKTLQVPSYTDFEQWITASAATTLISYKMIGSQVAAIVMNNNIAAHFFVDSMTSYQNLPTFISHYFTSNPAAFNDHPGAYAKQAADLFEQYFQYYGKYTGRLLIAADDILHQLPFEALTKDSSLNTFIGQEKSITYSYSFLQNAFSANNSYKNTAINFLGFEKDYLGFKGLPNAGKEADFLAKKFTTHQYNAQSVTDSVFQELLLQRNSIHIASHAVAGDARSQPFLVLQKKLYTGQIQYMVANTPLIVLAACETGAGAISNNEGIQSLGRSFISKGAGGVVAARWNVDDAASALFLTAFYDGLKNTGDVAGAMQLARRDYLKNTTSIAEKNPWLWACYFYQGRDVSVAFRSGLAMPYYGWLAISCIVLLLFIFIRKIKK